MKNSLTESIETIREKFPDVTVLENEPMKNHCSFRTGGPVRAFALPAEEASFLRLCAFLKEKGIRPYLLGNGTNVVFPDEGAEEIFVLCTTALQEVRRLPDGTISASAGLPLSRLAAFACDNELTGLEFASGIPGTVGGGILMNAGAYGGELKDVVVSVRCLNCDDGSIQEIPAAECAFGYRQSRFQSGGSILLSGKFRLSAGEKEQIAARMKELNQRRRDKQPLDLPSAGSAFRRPEGHFAAALIEECGLKGARIGGAQVSEKHAGFIVNTGGATTEDLRRLLSHVRSEVYRQKKISLQPEIILVGTDGLCTASAVF